MLANAHGKVGPGRSHFRARTSGVVIGRNEGNRLRTCLKSLMRCVSAVVYVDSGSIDGSVAMARSLGAEVVALDESVPFTAARARNAGLERLMQLRQDVAFVQLLDGDTELVDGWMERAAATLDENQEVAAVCGRRRERHRDASVYNLLCDLEWDSPIGEGVPFGGDVLMRVAAMKQVGGYNPTVIAGEDRELCVRLQEAGWKVLRIDAEMTLHDAAMEKFSQWWKRSQRTGHCLAQGAHLHGKGTHRHRVRASRSVWIWGLLFPATILGLAGPTKAWSLLGLLLYALQAIRIYRHCSTRGWTRRESRLYALFCMLGKFPELVGMLQFHYRRILGRPFHVIEYKGASLSANATDKPQ